MCIAIYKPANTDIPEAYLHKAWIHNSDGGGFAFIKDGKVEIAKGFMKFSDWQEAYEEAVFLFPDSPFLIHFRIRSMGDRSPENTHPFEMACGGALIHNGTIRGTGAQYGEGKSDTALFVEKYGKALTFENVEMERHYLEDALDYNKLVILYDDGRHHILNKAYGVEENGVWYSNETYKPWQQRQGNSYCYT
jgi:predicted glutamine amidotransferase